MAREGIQITDETFLRKVPLPVQTNSYTVISHGYIIDKVRKTLQENNFEIENETYSYSYGGDVALCKVLIKSTKDPDMGMIFTWWNSYNKSLKFGCAVGGFIYDNNTTLIGSEGMMWVRKHTGTADEESKNIIEQLISQAEMFFDKIILEKNRMKQLPLTTETFGCIMGAMYFELDLITPTQASAVKNEYKKPQHQYKDKDTLWGLYKLLMFGIDDSDLRKWANIQQKIHYTIMNEYAIATSNPLVNTEELVAKPENVDFNYFSNPVSEQLEEVPAAPSVTWDHIHGASEEDAKAAEELLKPMDMQVLDILTEQYKIDPALGGYYVGAHLKADASIQENVEGFFKYMNRPIPELILDAPVSEDSSTVNEINITAEELVAPVKILSPEIAKEKVEQLSALEDDVEGAETSLSDQELDALIKEDIHVGPPEMYLGGAASQEITLDDILKDPETNTQSDLKAVPEGFEWLLNDDDVADDSSIELMAQGLEIPAEIKELNKLIETKMNRLYGKVSPFTYVEGNRLVLVTLDETKEVFYIKTN
jgi:hypothetical protein